MKIYDLRSDTLTLPSEEMKKAIYNADLGDDVYGEDPAVNKLQETAAGITGKEDALFVPSGSMGNLIPLMLNCGRGNEVLTHKNSHILHYELSSISAIAGVMPVPVEGPRGILKPENLIPNIKPDIYYLSTSKMIEVENTHNMEGGSCYTLPELKAVYGLAETHKMKVHMDGARIFNAAAATGNSVESICSYTDTVTFCLSKGLGAPAGSMLCGTADFIKEARRTRKMLGGGMRQAGILAAAGIYALENNIDRITDDHDNAKLLADAIADTEWGDVAPGKVETNIVFFDTVSHSAAKISESLGKQGVLCSPAGAERVRLVTCLNISKDDIKEVCGIIRSLTI